MTTQLSLLYMRYRNSQFLVSFCVFYYIHRCLLLTVVQFRCVRGNLIVYLYSKMQGLGDNTENSGFVGMNFEH
jgi:hypothetical protein